MKSSSATRGDKSPRYSYEACCAGSAAEGGFVIVALTFTSGRGRQESALRLYSGFRVSGKVSDKEKGGQSGNSKSASHLTSGFYLINKENLLG